MLRDVGVATTSGIDFDPNRGDTYLRLSYAGAEADMREAVRRIGTWLKAK